MPGYETAGFFGICERCAAWTWRDPDDIQRPCDLCGSVRFWVYPYEPTGPGEAKLFDVTTGEMLPGDPPHEIRLVRRVMKAKAP
jgi:hypothetical protein